MILQYMYFIVIMYMVNQWIERSAGMRSKFNVVSSNLDFPLIFWLAKFHKNLVKFRAIAGSREKVLYPPEKIVGSIMKILTNHFY